MSRWFEPARAMYRERPELWDQPHLLVLATREPNVAAWPGPLFAMPGGFEPWLAGEAVHVVGQSILHVPGGVELDACDCTFWPTGLVPAHLARPVVGALIVQANPAPLLPCPYMHGVPVAWIDRGGFPFRLGGSDVLDYASATITWPSGGVLWVPDDPTVPLRVVQRDEHVEPAVGDHHLRRG